MLYEKCILPTYIKDLPRDIQACVPESLHNIKSSDLELGKPLRSFVNRSPKIRSVYCLKDIACIVTVNKEVLVVSTGGVSVIELVADQQRGYGYTYRWQSILKKIERHKFDTLSDLLHEISGAAKLTRVRLEWYL